MLIFLHLEILKSWTLFFLLQKYTKTWRKEIVTKQIANVENEANSSANLSRRVARSMARSIQKNLKKYFTQKIWDPPPDMWPVYNSSSHMMIIDQPYDHHHHGHPYPQVPEACCILEGPRRELRPADHRCVASPDRQNSYFNKVCLFVFCACLFVGFLHLFVCWP